MSVSPNHRDQDPVQDRQVDTSVEWLGWLCQSEAVGVVHGYEAEYGHEISVEQLGDLQLALMATTAPSLTHRLSPEAPRPPSSPVYGVRPERVFMGMAVTIVETPATERSQDLENITQFLANNFEEWGDIEQLRQRVLYPVLQHINDEHPGPNIYPEARAKAISYARLIPHLTRPIYDKLRGNYRPLGPRTELLWNHFSTLMEAAEKSRRLAKLRVGKADFVSDYRAIRRIIE